MADHLQATLGLGGAASDLLHPHRVMRAYLLVGNERRGAGLEKKFHRKTVLCQAIIDDLAKRVFGRGLSAEFQIGQVDAVEDPQLMTCGQLQRAGIALESIGVTASIVSSDRLADQSPSENAIEVCGLNRIPRLAALASIYIALGRSLFHPRRAVLEVLRRRVIDAGHL